jgi:hypothetical protein
MSHLSPETIIDILDGACDAPAHLAACERCQQQMAGVRAVMASVSGASVPEPSPLFWDHFSSRVRASVAAEAMPRRSWFGSWRFAVPMVAAAAVAALVVAVSVRRQATAPSLEHAAAVAQVSRVGQAAGAEGPGTADNITADAGDPSLALVVDLAQDIDVDPATVTGVDADDADRAVAHMSESELRALAELLKARMPPERVS